MSDEAIKPKPAKKIKPVRNHLKENYPKIPIDWDEFDKLCKLQCTLEEFACYFNCSIDTIEDRVLQTHGVKFSEYYGARKGLGKISLRRAQFNKALRGNTTMQIWLGKQLLGQVDKQEIKQEINVNHVIYKSTWNVLPEPEKDVTPQIEPEIKKDESAED